MTKTRTFQLWMIMASFCFSANLAFAKFFVASQPFWQFIFIRNIWTLIFLLMLKKVKEGSFFIPLSPSLSAQSILRVSCLILGFFSLKHISLYDFNALFFIAPILTLCAGSLINREKLSSKHIASAFLSFIGVVIIFFYKFSANIKYLDIYFFVILSAILYAASNVISNKFFKKYTPLELSLNYTLIAILGSIFFLEGEGWPSFFIILIYAVGALINLLALLFLFKAFSSPSLQKVALLEYCQLPFSLGFDVFIWENTPSYPEILGSLCILIASLTLINGINRKEILSKVKNHFLK